MSKEQASLQASGEAKQDAIETTQRTIAELQVQMQQGSDWTPAQKAAKRELEQEASHIHSVLKEKQATQAALYRDVNTLKEQIRLATEANAAVVREKEEVQAAIVATTRNTKTQESKKEIMDEEMKSIQMELDGLKSMLLEREGAISAGESDLQRRERSAKSVEAQCGVVLQQCASLMKKAAELTDELDAQMVRSQSLVSELASIEDRTRKYHAEAATLTVEKDKAVDLHDLCVQKIAAAVRDQEAVSSS